MAKKDKAGGVSPFDAHLEPNETILWIEHQEWLNDRRLTQGHKVSWGVILVLFLVLSFGITLLFGFEALLLIYGLAGVQILFAYLQGSFPYWILGGFPSNKSNNPTYFQCWYAVTNRRLLCAFKEEIDSMTLLETVNISKVVERNRRGRLNFGRPGKVLRFIDIADAENVYALILEQQRILQKMEQHPT